MNLFALTPSVSPGRLPTRSHVHSRGVAQWLARFVRDEEAGGSSPLTPTIFLTIIVTPLEVLPIISPLPRLLPY